MRRNKIPDPENQVQRITQKIRRFRDERDWMPFHSHKNLAISLSLEAAEVLEHFQWKTDAESAAHAAKHRLEIGEELADVAMYLFELADNMKIDLGEAMERKMAINAKRYPVAKAKGRHTKYNQL